MKARISKIASAFVLAVSLLPSSAYAQSPGSTKTTSVNEDILANVIAKARKSVVKVQADGKFVSLGTIVEADGYILSKLSELKKNDKISDKINCELSDGRTPLAKVVAKNELFDLAMLKVDIDDLTPVEWTLSKAAPIGSWVVSVGSGRKPAAFGVVGVTARPVKADLEDQLPAIKPNGGYLGIQMDEPLDNAPGVRITIVTDKSPAKSAGLKEEDVIVGVNDTSITTVNQLRELISSYKPDETVTLKIKRSSEELTIKAKLGKRPTELGGGLDRSDFQNKMGSTLSEIRKGFPMILQHDSVIKPADCGAPLVDLDGHVIGINIARAGRTESYAIPSETILPLLVDMIAGKSVLRSSRTSKTREQLLKEKFETTKAELKLAQQNFDDAEKAFKAYHNYQEAQLKVLEEKHRKEALPKMEELPKPVEKP